MSAAYKSEYDPIWPVAVQVGQIEVHSPQHDLGVWEEVACPQCDKRFALAPNKIYGARKPEEYYRDGLVAFLAEDHAANRPHKFVYDLRD